MPNTRQRSSLRPPSVEGSARCAELKVSLPAPSVCDRTTSLRISVAFCDTSNCGFTRPAGQREPIGPSLRYPRAVLHLPQLRKQGALGRENRRSLSQAKGLLQVRLWVRVRAPGRLLPRPRGGL